jgi:hypothetical protein
MGVICFDNTVKTKTKNVPKSFVAFIKYSFADILTNLAIDRLYSDKLYTGNNIIL